MELFAPGIRKAAHGVKELWKALLDEGIEPGDFIFDTEVAAYLLAPTDGSYELEKLGMTYYNQEFPKAAPPIWRRGPSAPGRPGGPNGRPDIPLRPYRGPPPNAEKAAGGAGPVDAVPADRAAPLPSAGGDGAGRDAGGPGGADPLRRDALPGDTGAQAAIFALAGEESTSTPPSSWAASSLTSWACPR